MKSESEIVGYLQEAENNAIVAMAANKWERYGYWAAQVTHLRGILGLRFSPSPFRPFAELARTMLTNRESKGDD